MFLTSRPWAVTTVGAPPKRTAESPVGHEEVRVDDVRLESAGGLPHLAREARCRRLPPPRPSVTTRSMSCPRAASARSMPWTNTPRSGSSGPGYICETRRIFTQTCAAARVVRAEHVAQLVADLADGGPRRSASRIGGSRFASPSATAAHLGERLRRLVGVPLGAHLRRPLELPPLRLGVEPVQLDRLRLLLLVTVDPDDHLLAGLDLGGVLVRRVLDLRAGRSPARSPRPRRRPRPRARSAPARAASSSSVSASMK